MEEDWCGYSVWSLLLPGPGPVVSFLSVCLEYFLDGKRVVRSGQAGCLSATSLTDFLTLIL